MRQSGPFVEYGEPSKSQPSPSEGGKAKINSVDAWTVSFECCAS
jgi:hypothetical protein